MTAIMSMIEYTMIKGVCYPKKEKEQRKELMCF